MPHSRVLLGMIPAKGDLIAKARVKKTTAAQSVRLRLKLSRFLCYPHFMAIWHGIDMTSVERIGGIALEELTLKRVFTETEIAEGFSVRETYRRLAMVFASKEALMKALGTGWAKGVGWKDIEVTGFSGRSLSVRVSGMAGEVLGNRSVKLDAASTRSIAVAVAVIEG